jgi:outer membrane protein
MFSIFRFIKRSLVGAVLILLMATSFPVLAQQVVNVAVIGDGPNDRLQFRSDVYVRELLALTKNEFDVRIHYSIGDWTHDGIAGNIEKAYENPGIDLVLVMGFVSNQIATTRTHYPKPTFLPVLLDPSKLIHPPIDQKSRIPNLNYLAVYNQFGEDIAALQKLVKFNNLVLIMDQELSDSIGGLKASAVQQSGAMGVTLIEVTHDGVNHNLMDSVPDLTEAVFIGALPRMPQDDFAKLVSAINHARIPSYSFVGTADVEQGLLMTSSESRDIERQARLNALNMQSVMLGERAEDQLVSSQNKQQFTINMDTARLLSLSPSFDVLNVSRLINERAKVAGREFGLKEITEEAIDKNQDLLSRYYGFQANSEAIGLARASLMPQLGLGATHDLRKVSPVVEAGLFAERTTDGSLSLQQLIYSDSATANLTIQKELQLAREADLNGVKLDIIQAAATAYYTVLNAREQLGVQEDNLIVTRRNLELARDRVKLGSSSASDVYRWQAEEARARILVINARADSFRAWNRLNRLLHRTQTERIALRRATFDEPFVMTRIEFDKLITSPADYAKFSNFFLDRGLSQSPDLVELDAQITAKRRDLTSQRRSYWLPDFSLGGRYTSNFGQVGGSSVTGEELTDWTVGVQATLPLFSGGERRAKVSRADFEVRQLETLRIATAERVEENIRTQLHLAQAAYGQIDLSTAAAEASHKNYELVADAYARGTVSIIQLLDAQDASLSANASSIDSLYNFLITIMALQRAVGGYDYLLPEDERINLAQSLREYLARSGS